MGKLFFCREKGRVWQTLLLLITGLLVSVYLYLYIKVFDRNETSSVHRVVGGDTSMQAVLKDKFGYKSNYRKVMGQSEKAKTKLPLLTLFTSWNANTEKDLVHNLTIINWKSLMPYVIPVIFTNETSVAKQCSQLGWETRHISVAAADGIPVLKYMYRDVMNNYNSSFYAYSNGDILFTDTLLKTLQNLLNSNVDLNTPVLIVGQRTNVDNVTLDEGSEWNNITAVAKERGKLFESDAIDYFITTRAFPWKDIAEVVIGRRAYDNWLVFSSRKAKHNVIDATKTLEAVHQTTKAGNFEGYSHKHRDYNHILLVKMYKKIKYSAGVTYCIDKFTQYENHIFQVKHRAVPKLCSI